MCKLLIPNDGLTERRARVRKIIKRNGLIACASSGACESRRETRAQISTCSVYIRMAECQQEAGQAIHFFRLAEGREIKGDDDVLAVGGDDLDGGVVGGHVLDVEFEPDEPASRVVSGAS